MALFIGLSIVRFGSPGWRDVWASVGIDPFVAAAGYGLVLVSALWLQGLYRLRTRLSIRREVIDVLVAILLLAVVVFTTLYLLKLPNVSRLFLLLLFSFQAVLTLISRASIRALFVRLRARGYNARYMLVVGANPAAKAFADSVEGHVELGLRPIGYLAAPNDPALSATWDRRRPVLGTVDEIQDVLHGTVVDEVAICLSLEDWSLVEPITRLCEDEGRIVRIPLTETTMIIPGGRIEDFHGMQILSLVYGPDRILGIAIKRLLDIVIATAALIVFSPLLLILGALIWLQDGRPILFRQERVGLHGRPFRVAKFRTMVPDAEARLSELEACQRDPGPRLQDDRRPAPQPVRTLAAPDEPRRAAAAVERRARRDERRRSAATAAPRGRRLRHLAPPAPVDETRHHRPVAGRGTARSGLRPLGAPRPRLHRPLVALARRQDRRPDDPRDAGRRGALSALIPWRRTGSRRRTA